MSIDPYTHMEEAWRLEGNPFPPEGIRHSADEPFSPAVFPEETADFYSVRRVLVFSGRKA
jgi:hypothetical protein